MSRAGTPIEDENGLFSKQAPGQWNVHMPGRHDGAGPGSQKG